MKRIFILTAVFLLIISNITYVFAAKSISDLNKEKGSIKEKTSAAQNALNDAKNQKSEVLKQVEALDTQLSAVTDELEKLSSRLDETKIRLADNQTQLHEATEKRENQYSSLKKRMRTMYESGDVGYLQIILDSEGFTDFLRRVEYINKIMEYDQNMFDEYQKTEQIISDKVVEIEKEKESIEVLSAEQAVKKQALDESIREKEQLVAKLSQEEATYLQQLSDLEKADKEVSNMIIQAQRAAQARASQSSGRIYAAAGGTLQYPVPGYRGYSYNSPYGYRSSPISGKSEFHTGVDLKATMGTDIVAAESGTVLFSGNKGGYGKTVIVDHGNGISTLYAHNSQLIVSVGQSVQRGQVISKAGTTGYSTGVHLHFEVRINGKHTDPAPYIGH